MTKRAKRGRRPSVELLEGRALLTAGALDTTFGGTGIVTHDFGWSTQPASNQAVAIQPWNGQAVVALFNSTSGSGVTLTRSMTPARSSASKPNPLKIPPKHEIETNRPGT